jgi:ABC-type transport system involved in multi-copper enzyme maturation permease subunit
MTSFSIHFVQFIVLIYLTLCVRLFYLFFSTVFNHTSFFSYSIFLFFTLSLICLRIMLSKRKAAKKFFTNSFTVKNRKRLNNMSEHEKRIDDAKRADLVNEIYYIKKLKTTKKWINVDVFKRKKLKDRVKFDKQFVR